MRVPRWAREARLRQQQRRRPPSSACVGSAPWAPWSLEHGHYSQETPDTGGVRSWSVKHLANHMKGTRRGCLETGGLERWWVQEQVLVQEKVAAQRGSPGDTGHRQAPGEAR